jgi:hypothetical protein
MEGEEVKGEEGKSGIMGWVIGIDTVCDYQDYGRIGSQALPAS